MESTPRGPFGSAHPVGKRTPRKRDRVDTRPESATIPSTSSALPCKASRKHRYVNAGQQHPHPHPGTTRTGQEEGSTSNTEIAHAQIPIHPEALKAKNRFVLHQRELLNPAAGRQEEVGDNISHPGTNGLPIPPPWTSLSDAYVQAVAEAIPEHNSQVQAVRAKVPDPKMRHAIFHRKLKELLSVKRDGMDYARAYEGILIYRRAIAQEKNRFPALFEPPRRGQEGRRRARAGAEMPPSRTPVPDRVVPGRVQSQGGATTDAPDPRSNNISKTEADMLHAYILDHPL